MSGIATAIGVSAAVGVAGSLIASNQASKASRGAANTAAQVQEDALAQQKAEAAPYTALGQAAIPKYEELLGLGKDGSAGALKTLRELPGYQFAKSEGISSTDAQLSAMGLGKSGNTLQAVDQYTTGLADQTYNSELANLRAPVQIGQSAASGVSADIGNTANNLANIGINQGNNQANIDMNMIAGITKAAGAGINAYTTNQTLQALGGGYGGGAPSDPYAGGA